MLYSTIAIIVFPIGIPAGMIMSLYMLGVPNIAKQKNRRRLRSFHDCFVQGQDCHVSTFGKLDWRDWTKHGEPVNIFFEFKTHRPVWLFMSLV